MDRPVAGDPSPGIDPPPWPSGARARDVERRRLWCDVYAAAVRTGAGVTVPGDGRTPAEVADQAVAIFDERFPV